VKVLFDIPRLQENPFGMQVYTEQVLRALLSNAPPGWQFSIRTMGLKGRRAHSRRLERIDPAGKARNEHLMMSQRVYDYLLALRADPLLRQSLKADLLHSFGWRALPSVSCPLVVTIQDVIPLKMREGSPEFIDHVHRLLSGLVRQADAIITISHSSQQDIVEWLGADEAKFEVIANGVDSEFFTPLQDHELVEGRHCLERLKVKSPYLLNIGANVPRKNKVNLIKAFEILKQRHRVPHQLVLAGGARLDDACQKAIETSSARDHILNIGYVSDIDALRLLQQADVFVFPSTYEGFGLPPLEAMSCGTPVAMSNTSALPEVGADAAVYFDPLDPEAISESIVHLLSDQTRRRECITSGILRSRSMTWTSNAQKTLAVYKKLCSATASACEIEAMSK
jgi:glycosyltransferase involved in cell wall biosynthesis